MFLARVFALSVMFWALLARVRESFVILRLRLAALREGFVNLLVRLAVVLEAKAKVWRYLTPVREVSKMFGSGLAAVQGITTKVWGGLTRLRDCIFLTMEQVSVRKKWPLLLFSLNVNKRKEWRSAYVLLVFGKCQEKSGGMFLRRFCPMEQNKQQKSFMFFSKKLI